MKWLQEFRDSALTIKTSANLIAAHDRRANAKHFSNRHSLLFTSTYTSHGKLVANESILDPRQTKNIHDRLDREQILIQFLDLFLYGGVLDIMMEFCVRSPGPALPCKLQRLLHRQVWMQTINLINVNTQVL